jgi:isoquinoline 1-oxidoreductase beta subunit
MTEPGGTTTQVRVNGRTVELPAALADTPLLWVLRDHLGLTGAKFGCGEGVCGACTVLVDGHAVPSCKVSVAEVAGAEIATVEGLAADDPVIAAFIAEQAPQCGFCQPAMVMTATGLLAARPETSDAEIDEAMSHVLCRCGTYPRVRRAVRRLVGRAGGPAPFPAEPPADLDLAPSTPGARFNPWIEIAEDGTVTVIIGRSEMGQGVATALPMLVAEELDYPVARMRTRAAPVDLAYYNSIIRQQITVGSLSMQTLWRPLRSFAAQVRGQLIAAAAARWGVDAADCATEAGVVIHRPSGRRLDYGDLAAAAAALPPPEAPRLKAQDEFTVLGRPTARLEIPGHLRGRTVFGADVVLDGMLCASVLQAPVLGAKLAACDDAAALGVHGVRAVIALDEAAAVIADDHWAAIQGRAKLDCRWRDGLVGLSSAGVAERFRQALGQDGQSLNAQGDPAAALARAAEVFEADYHTPYLAHAAIEPMNATAWVRDGQCDVWVPTQGQSIARDAAAAAAGVDPAATHIHTTFLGGGFGRRSVPDVVAQAVTLSRRIGAPVQLLWTRDEDMAHDRFRPASLMRMRAGLDRAGAPLAWSQTVVGPTLAGEGVTMPYAIADQQADHVLCDPDVPHGYWRSVGSSQNAFAIESFIDELAHRAGADPVAYRLGLLGGSPRHRAVLERCAALAGWPQASAPGRALGAAVYYAHGGHCAQIAEVGVEPAGRIVVHKVTAVVDCGFAINPDTVKAQIEGGVVFGLTAALKGEITLDDGRVLQKDFRDYPLLTFAECPQITVEIMASDAPPTGAGECGVPPIAPAVANALFRASGRRLRSLPLRLD